MQNLFTQLTQILPSKTEQEGLSFLAENYAQDTVFSTSFGIEDQVIAHLIFDNKLPISVFTLDTGRLFPETYTLWARTKERYQMPILAYYPDAEALEEFLTQNGPNAFYESIELRKQCCHLRKVLPLKRALAGKKVWITGLRAEQSNNRESMPQVELDIANNIVKYHPLLDWSTEQVFDYARKHNILYNPLHDKGFVSIGCAPCTRAIKAGEDFRAGRWWWEDNSKKECGLHHS